MKSKTRICLIIGVLLIALLIMAVGCTPTDTDKDETETTGSTVIEGGDKNSAATKATFVKPGAEAPGNSDAEDLGGSDTIEIVYPEASQTEGETTGTTTTTAPNWLPGIW